MANFLRYAKHAAMTGSRILQKQSIASRQLKTVRQICCSASLAAKKYSRDHEWIEVEGNFGKIGISEYAQDQLGDIVYVEFPEVGKSFNQLDECGVVESVKSVSDIICPVSGTVSKVNEEVVEEPGLINKHPLDTAWLFEMELSKPEELGELLSEEEYQKFVKGLDH